MSQTLITMTHQKLGDFLLLTPFLKRISENCIDVVVGVPDPLFEFYNSNQLLPNILRVSEAVRMTDAADVEVIDLSYPLLEKVKLPEKFRRSAKAPFLKLQHSTKSYGEALSLLFPKVDLNFTPEPYVDLDFDVELLEGLHVQPFQYFTVHAGSDCAYKNWSLENFEKTVQLVCEEFPLLKCLSVVGPKDESLFVVQAPPLNYREVKLPLDQVAHVLAGSAFHLDNDSGVHHLAGVLDVPTISVWGPTGPGTWSSLSKRNFIHWGGPACIEHCEGARMSECPDRVCLSSVKPTDLLPSVRQILSAYN